METIKQAFGSKNCVACVAAMIAGTTVEHFEQWAGTRALEEKSYNDIELIAYCVLRGICIGGYGFQFDDIQLDEEINLQLMWEIKLKDTEAYLAVRSMTNREWTHAVYWDGKMVHDPSPAVDEPIPLEKYEIVTVYPINRCGQEFKYDWMAHDA